MSGLSETIPEVSRRGKDARAWAWQQGFSCGLMLSMVIWWVVAMLFAWWRQ